VKTSRLAPLASRLAPLVSRLSPLLLLSYAPAALAGPVYALLAIEVFGVTVGAILFNIALSYAITALLAPDRKPVSTDFSSTQTTIQPAGPWRVIYGQVRTGGEIKFRHATDTIGDTTATERINVPVSAPYTVRVQFAADYVSTEQVRQVLYGGSQPWQPPIYRTFAATGGAPAAGEYSVSAGIYTFNAADKGLPLEVVYVRRAPQIAHNRLHLVIVFAAHEVAEIGDIYFDDEAVPLDADGNATGRHAGYAYVSKHLGTDDQAADSTLMQEAPDKWTSEHRLRGHAYIYVRLLRNPNLFPGGTPNISAMIRGRKVFDPRDSQTRWTPNAALCCADYLANSRFGLGLAYGTEIDSTLLTAAANICDERVPLAAATAEFTADPALDTLTVAAEARLPAIGEGVRVASSGTLPGGLSAATTYYAFHAAGGALKLATSYANALLGTAINITSAGSGTHTLTYHDEVRYACNGMVSTSDLPQSIIERMLTSMSGRLVYVSGTWRLRAGAYLSPGLTLDEGDLRGPVEITTLLSRREACNGVKGVYVSPENEWQPSDFPPVDSDVFMAQDNGERIWRDIDLPFTTSSAMAQRIAKIELLRSRQQITGSFPFKLGAYKAEPPETVMVTNARFGWSAKVFEISESTLSFEDGALGVDAVLRETDPTIYDWATSEETLVDPAPNTNLPNPFVIAAPGVPSVTEVLYATLDGVGVRSLARVSWAESADGQAWRYELNWKLRADTEWSRRGDISGLQYDVLDLAIGTYEFRVRAVSTLNVVSEWAQLEKEIFGLSANPAAPTGVSLGIAGGLAVITLEQHPELDVLRGGRILVRHSELTTGVSWEESLSIGNSESYPGDSVVIGLPLKPGTYLLKAQDSGGQRSVSFTSVKTKQASVLTFSPLDNLQEDATFPGAHDGTREGAGVMSLLAHNHADLPGTSGNYLSTPDSAALDITGDLDIRVAIAAEDYTPASLDDLVAKWGVASNSSYRVALNTTGIPEFFISTDGSNQFSSASTAALPTLNTNTVVLRVTFDGNNGAAGNDTRFYTSPFYDPATGTPSWTQLGATVTKAGTPTIFSGSSPLNIGANIGGTANLFDGRVMWAEVRNGIDGTLAASFDASDGTAGATSLVSAATGETWTVHQSGSPAAQLHANETAPVAGVYSFSAGFDFLAVTKARVTGQIEAVVENVNDLFDSDELFDSPELFDGDADGSLCDAWLETRDTDDNPAGTPAWSEWRRLDSTEVDTRAMQFRLQMRSFDPDFNIRVGVLRVRAEELP